MTTSMQFLDAWRNVASRRSTQMLSTWRESKLFTNVVLNNPECVLVDVGSELGLQAYPSNYYSVDGLLYSERDLVPGRRKGQFWFRSIEVAFEHENLFNHDIYQEIAHLLILRARLSVLGTYPNRIDEDLMRYFHDIIEPCAHSSELDANESFLMIFGWPDPFRWDGYVYKQSGWKMLTAEPNKAMQATCEDARA